MAASALLLALAGQAVAYPWVANVEGVDSSLLPRAYQKRDPNGPAACPVNPDHKGAEPYTKQFPYCGAIGDTTPGKFPCNNNRVPAPGDTAHRYIAPGPLDIRGPCPGINTAANHGFLSRDGITTYSELVAMQQNVYGVSYDLANLLAVFGVGLDGDLVTQKLSIGCDATARTSPAGAVMKSGEYGLSGHDKFESDASLTRNDYFLAGGDDFSFNRTLYDNMMNNYCKGNCNLDAMADYRLAQWETSKATNPNFFFGPGSLLLYGAASFLYELFPAGGNKGVADKATMDSFFLEEKLPDNWVSRSESYTSQNVGGQIFAMYKKHPIPFGANTGKPNSYVGIGFSGPATPENMGTPEGVTCALYLLATAGTPATLSQSPLMSSVQRTFATLKLNSIFGPLFSNAQAANPAFFGCPLSPHETN